MLIPCTLSLLTSIVVALNPQIVAGRDAAWRGGDPSSDGVQRDLLPIIEGSTVQTKHGNVNTDHMLFICSGAFHSCTPSDLMAELQVCERGYGRERGVLGYRKSWLCLLFLDVLMWMSLTCRSEVPVFTPLGLRT